MKTRGIMTWGVRSVAQALGVPVGISIKLMQDGRLLSALVEVRLRQFFPGFKPAPVNATYDLIDPSGKLWEVRSITKSGAHFSPSYMRGSGRNFDRDGFIDRIKTLEGYILADTHGYPIVRYWAIPTAVVWDWYSNCKLTGSASGSRNKILGLLEEAFDA